MTQSYREVYKNFIESILEADKKETYHDKKITHDEFVKSLPNYIREIDEAFSDVFSSAKRVKCNSTGSQRVKDMLLDDLRRLQRKVKTFISVASEEEESEEMENVDSEEDDENEEDEDSEEVKERKKKKKSDPCWTGYEQVGMKKKGKREVPNCVPEQQVYDDPDDVVETSGMGGGAVQGPGSKLNYETLKKYGKRKMKKSSVVEKIEGI
jgi:hypothetical protein